jgi:hypothetical protein
MDGRSPHPRGEFHVGASTIERHPCRIGHREYTGNSRIQRKLHTRRKPLSRRNARCQDTSRRTAAVIGNDAGEDRRAACEDRRGGRLLRHPAGRVQVERSRQPSVDAAE